MLALSAMLASPAARAATYTDGDLLMGFWSTNASVTQSVLVNLGNAGNYRDQATNINALSIGSINTDLTTAFGSGWATAGDVFWSIAAGVVSAGGVNGDPLNTLYASKEEAVYGTNLTSGFVRQSSSTQATPRAKISTAGSTLPTPSLAGGSNGANSSVVLQDDTDAESWKLFMGAGATAFTYSTFGDIRGNAAGGITTTALDLFRAIPTGPPSNPLTGNSTYEGTFTIGSDGVISFGVNGPAAIPEPTRAVLALFGFGLMALRRRRSVKSAA